MTSSIFTYQDRLSGNPLESQVLDAYAELFGRVERKLFASTQATKKPAVEFKNEFIRTYGLTTRQFNAVRVQMDGKVSSIEERRPELIENLDSRIKKAKAKVKSLTKKIDDLTKALSPTKTTVLRSLPSNSTKLATGHQWSKKGKRSKELIPAEELVKLKFQLHHKKRYLFKLQSKHSALVADKKAGVVRMTFGSKKLFNEQFHLKENGWTDHDEWKAEWVKARSSQFMVLGSKDETGGCQGCVATVNDDPDKSLDLRLRLPTQLEDAFGKYLHIKGLKFKYGHEAILNALASSRVIIKEEKDATGKVKKTRTMTGTALTYRFLRDERGWRVFVSVEVTGPQCITDWQLGAIGVDFNADHLAMAETDRFGNGVHFERNDLFLSHKTTDQRKALMGDAVKYIVQGAKAANKPLVIEKLDFAKKKKDLASLDPKRARMLSSLSYRSFQTMLKASALRAGVEVIEINPAYTSVIGAVNHAAQRGISVHLGAALAIARRGLGLGEKPIAGYRSTLEGHHKGGVAVVPAKQGGHVTFGLPVRNRRKHVWTQWSGISSNLKAALSGHYRCKASQRHPPPLQDCLHEVCAIRFSRARFPGASHLNCEDGALDNIPFE